MNRLKFRGLSCLLLAVLLLATVLPRPVQAAATPTGLGLAEHGIKAYRDGWVYAYAAKGEIDPATGKRSSDCSGLVYAYFADLGLTEGLRGSVNAQVSNNCIFSGSLSDGLPNIHGLVATFPDTYGGDRYSHIGIYVGGNLVVDNSDYGVNMLQGELVGGGRGWTAWHLFDHGTRYPVDGWYALDGKMVHYTQYEYDTNVEIDGYTLGADGYARTASGDFAPVDNAILSSQYASAQDVAAYLKAKGYSGSDDSSGGYNAAITGDIVRLRAEPNTTCATLTSLYRGARLNILEEVSGQTITDGAKSSPVWYKVQTKAGQTGYISALYVQALSVTPPAAPAIAVNEGTVSITCDDPEAKIYYTTDGTAPTTASLLYTGPVDTLGCTYRAVAVKTGVSSETSQLTVLSCGSTFSDFNDTSWFFSYVDRAVGAGLFNGTGNEIFAPNRSITRMEFVTVLARLAGAELSDYTETPFRDVNTSGAKSMWQAVAWAAENGYVNGFGDGTFRPNDTITREQMCMILAGYAGLSPAEDGAAFADDGQISGWAKTAVYACRDAGLIEGIGGGKVDPRGFTTRAQASVVFLRLYDLP